MVVDQLEIRADKLTGYLLDINHPDGGSKAKFFISHGFDPKHPEALAYALAEHARRGWPGTSVPTMDGAKHIFGEMDLPDGSTRKVLVVWQVKAGESLARLVTARPAKS